MKIQIDTFKADDILAIQSQEGVACLEQFRTVEKTQRFSYTMRVDGRIVCCAGIIDYWEGRGEAWAVIQKGCAKEFLAIHNFARRALKVIPIRRVEATVSLGFPMGHRWVKLLGFELEAPMMKNYGVSGDDFALYAKVKS